MKKVIFIFINLIIVVSIFLILMQLTELIQLNEYENTKIDILMEAFSSTGAGIVSSEIYISGKAGHVFDDAEKRNMIITELIASAVPGTAAGAKPFMQQIENDNSFGTAADYAFNENASIHISLLKDPQGKPEDDYLAAVSLTDTSQEPDLKAAVSGIIKVFEKYGIEADVNICITGSIEGKPESNELEKICQDVFKAAEAKEVEGIRDNGLISVSAFAPSIDGSVKVNGRDINLNIAIRYNSYEGKTYIWLATPVITTEY